MDVSAAFAPTQADLETAVGGAHILLQLADAERTGSLASAAAQARITAWTASAVVDIRSAVGVKHEPEAIEQLDAETLQSLRFKAKYIAARYAYVDGGGGLAMPEQLEKLVRESLDWIEKVREGKAVLARSAGGRNPSLAQFVGVINHDPQGTGWSQRGLSGFR